MLITRACALLRSHPLSLLGITVTSCLEGIDRTGLPRALVGPDGLGKPSQSLPINLPSSVPWAPLLPFSSCLASLSLDHQEQQQGIIALLRG